jgi:hypothetical protein
MLAASSTASRRRTRWRFRIMWQPNRVQWSIIWSIAILLILAWPPAEGRSLLVKLANWAVDPADALPTLPAALPMGLDDNGDAVTAHDAELTAYYRRHDSSTVTRWRMDWKTAADPFDPVTERQLLVGVAVVGALLVWRLQQRR